MGRIFLAILKKFRFWTMEEGRRRSLRMAGKELSYDHLWGGEEQADPTPARQAQPRTSPAAGRVTAGALPDAADSPAVSTPDPPQGGTSRDPAECTFSDAMEGLRGMALLPGGPQHHPVSTSEILEMVTALDPDGAEQTAAAIRATSDIVAEGLVVLRDMEREFRPPIDSVVLVGRQPRDMHLSAERGRWLTAVAGRLTIPAK